jgi:uncharacterized protein YbbK (DUF523 family)
MERILVSACFLGEKVRYDGKSKSLINETLQQWKLKKQLVSMCPEVSGGLSVPRAPAEIQPENGRILTCDGDDVSLQFAKGAQLALDICQQHNIRFALLKESSPSCGSTTIYDGFFQNKRIMGEGVTAALLIKNGIKVFSEDNIKELITEVEQVNAKPSPY